MFWVNDSCFHSNNIVDCVRHLEGWTGMARAALRCSAIELSAGVVSAPIDPTGLKVIGRSFAGATVAKLRQLRAARQR